MAFYCCTCGRGDRSRPCCAPSDKPIWVLIGEAAERWDRKAWEMLRQDFFTGGSTMTEQEYEKSIAEPLSDMLAQSGEAGSFVAIASKKFERYAEERLFARGVWRMFQRIRAENEKAIAALSGEFIREYINPIPDAPKPDPLIEQRSVWCRGAVKSVLTDVILKADADEIIREVRARTVK